MIWDSVLKTFFSLPEKFSFERKKQNGTFVAMLGFMQL